MSAFFVSKTHIRALVTMAATAPGGSIPMLPLAFMEKHPAAFRHLLTALKDGARFRAFPAHGYEDELGRALWLANADSLAARYPLDWESMLDDGGLEAVRGFRHTFVEFSAVEVIKACHCFAYQSCEVSDWAGSWAKAACEAIESHAVRKLPGYQAAPWGIDDPEGGATDAGPISIMSLIKRA